MDGSGWRFRTQLDNSYRTVDGIFEVITEAIENRAERVSVEYSPFVGAPAETFIGYGRFDDQDAYSISDMTIWSE